jgi:hypothetical protein
MIFRRALAALFRAAKAVRPPPASGVRPHRFAMGEMKPSALFILPIAQRSGGGPPKVVEGPRGSAETAAKWLRKLTLTTIVAALAAACTTVPRFEAAGDIHEFLVAIRDGDQARFDAHVDRPALKVQLKSRLIAGQASAHGDTSWAALGAALAGPLVDLGVDALVQPQTFRAVALRLGYAPDKPIPGQIAIASSLRSIGDGDVCVVTKKDGPCTLVFKDESGVWKLVGYEGDLGSLMHKHH